MHNAAPIIDKCYIIIKNIDLIYIEDVGNIARCSGKVSKEIPERTKLKLKSN